jgi:hypothetical protein
MSEKDKERRIHPRSEVDLPCEVQLLVADNNFDPYTAIGLIDDLSLSGAKLRIENLPKQVFQKVIRSNRHTRVTFHDSQSRGKIMLIGKIVWMHFDQKHNFFDIAFLFQNISPKAENAINNIVGE